MNQKKKYAAIILGASEYASVHLNNETYKSTSGKFMTYLKKTFHPAIKNLFNRKIDGLYEEIKNFIDDNTDADVFFLYYVGHGINDEDIYLGTASSNQSDSFLSLSLIELVKIIKKYANSVPIILIIDCCYSGELSKHISTIVKEKDHEKGIAVICAATADKRAVCKSYSDCSQFTGELLDLLTTGIKYKNRYLSLNDVCIELRAVFRKKGLKPLPVAFTSQGGNPSLIELFPNRAFTNIITKNVFDIRTLIGREEEMSSITQLLLSENRVVLVHGIGGIGKTFLCQHLYKRLKDNYTYIGWFEYIENLQATFTRQVDDDFFNLNDITGTGARWDIIIDKLQSLDSDTIIFIDDIKNTRDQDNYLSILTNLSITIIATSRLQFDTSLFTHYPLDILSVDACLSLFYTYYDMEKNDEYAHNIITLAGRHSLTVELCSTKLNPDCTIFKVPCKNRTKQLHGTKIFL